MNDKIISTIVIIIVILTAIGGIFFVYNATIGRTFEGLQSYVQAHHEIDIAAESLGMNKIQAIDKLLKELPACITFANIKGLKGRITYSSLQQKYVKSSAEALSIEDMTRRDNWKIVDVSKGTCKPVEQIVGIEKPTAKYYPIL